MKKQNVKPLVAAFGAAFLASVAISPMASAAENPFQADSLSAGYKLAASDMEGKCGEGKCGGSMDKTTDKAEDKAKDDEGKSGEGKCGGSMDKAKEKAKDKAKDGEGKCGEGKCGGSMGKK